MVALSDVRKSNSSLEKISSEFVAVFVGGTSGIGKAIVLEFAKHAHSPRAYIVGRNQQRAEEIINTCRGLCPNGTFAFIKADVSLLKNVDAVCDEIKQKEAKKLDLLHMSQGYITFEGRKETSEGLDTLLSLRYYSRMRFVHNLLPILTAHGHSSHAGRVVSILAAGHEDRLYTSDLPLAQPGHYGLFSNVSHSTWMTGLFIEEIAARNPTLSLLHVYPGLVKTEEFENGLFSWQMKLFFKWIMLPLITPFTVSTHETGERGLFHATSARYPSSSSGIEAATAVTMVKMPEGVHQARKNDWENERAGGAYLVNWNGEVVTKRDDAFREQRKKGTSTLVWEHTTEVFGKIENGERA